MKQSGSINDKRWHGVLAWHSKKHGCDAERRVDSFDNADQALAWLNNIDDTKHRCYVYHEDCIHLDNPYFAMAYNY